MSVGDLEIGVSYPIRKLEYVDAKFGETAKAHLNVAQVFLPRTIQITQEEAQTYDADNLSLLYRDKRDKAFNIIFI